MMHRIIPIVLVLISGAIGFMYIYPTYTGSITAAQQQIASYNSALSAVAAFSKKENDLLAKKNAISSNDLARLQTYLPDSVDNIQLIMDMDAIAARSGITLAGFSIQGNTGSGGGTTPITGGGPSTGSMATSTSNAAQPLGGANSFKSTAATDYLDLSVNATGTYDAFQNFLTSVEQSARPLDITKLSLTDSSTGVYTYALTFRIYWLH